MKKQCKTCNYLKDNYDNVDFVKMYTRVNRRYKCSKFENEITNLNSKCGLYIEKSLDK